MRTDRPVRRIELDVGVEVDRSAWWAQIPAIRALLDHGLNIPAGVTFLVGENGSGKSTLVEALAGVYGLNVEGGSRNARHRTRATESPLGEALRLVRTPKLVDRIRAAWGFGGVLVKFKLEVGVTEEELRTIAERSRQQSQADWMVANTLDGLTWALLGSADGYDRYRRDELPGRLLDAVERSHRERGDG